MASHFEKLENMYLRANVNAMLYNTTTCKIAKESAEIGLTISEKYFHSLGAIHGSVYFKLLDDAAFFAVNSIVEDVFVLTTSFHVNLTKPENQGKLRATGKLKHQSKNLFIAESILYNEEGNPIAFGTGNFVKSKIALTRDIGYF
ncbi:PaaI family thioesterase [Tenacibaculum sp. SG-28]|uniref:PaaI family thioesterase n=1 Tax=Tenacibaculum sp. SG-28 TaxID=754426 RepID=UPI000CF4C7AF|nr:PaaI family thioesterase [Tenacibaculum sp. SG-28]PQJ22782.1 thioesterase [Tenacibaculum sp. SG-28]